FVELLRQFASVLDQCADNRLRVFAFELHQHYVSRLALNQRCDLAAATAEDQVPFPVTRHRPILDRCRSLADRNGVSNLPVDGSFLCVLTRATHAAST